MPGLESPRLSFSSPEQHKESFLSDANTILFFPGGLSKDALNEFCAKHPLLSIFLLIEEHFSDEELLEVCIKVVDIILTSGCSNHHLPAVMPKCAAGLRAPVSNIKRIACDTIHQFLQSSRGASPSSLSQSIALIQQLEIVDLLVAALQDSELNVAMAAERCLKRLVEHPKGLDLLFFHSQFVLLALSGSSTARIRALSLAMWIGGQSEEGSRAVKGEGIMEAVSREILSPQTDILTAITMLQLLSDTAASSTGTQLILETKNIAAIATLIKSPDTQSAVRSAALSTAGKLTLTSTGNVADVEHLVKAVDSYLTLSDSNQQGGNVLVEAAMDAIGGIGKSKSGAESVLQTEAVALHVISSAFDTCHGSALQLSGLHALASIAGCDREEEDVTLCQQAEDRLKDLLYSQAANSSLAAVISAWLVKGEEMRIAVYRLLSCLLVRSWALAEFVGNARLVDALTRYSAEASPIEMEWQHACCVAMASAIGSQLTATISQQIKDQVSAAIRRRRYPLSNPVREAIPTVATMQRM